MPTSEAAAGAESSRTEFVVKGHELGQMVRRPPPPVPGPHGFPRGFLTIA